MFEAVLIFEIGDANYLITNHISVSIKLKFCDFDISISNDTQNEN